jgi:hypothetical protein
MQRLFLIALTSLSVGMMGGVATAQTQLNVEMSKTQVLVLPPPPQAVPEIDVKTPAESTLDMPLSLMAQEVLNSVCNAEINPEEALAQVPDLSEAHIKAQCPDKLPSNIKASGTEAVVRVSLSSLGS